MSDFSELSPAIVKALSFAGNFLKNEHALFRKIPFKPKSVGRGEASVLITLPAEFADGDEVHGGVYTILLDSLLAVSAWTRMETFEPMVTINLKTDFYQSVPPGTEIECRAHCEGIQDQVAVCHGHAMTLGGDVLAHAAGTFLVGGATAPGKGSRL